MPLTSTFREVQFPQDISYGSKGGSNFDTTVFESSSGREQRNVNWSLVKGKWDVSYGIKTLDQMSTLITFFMVMQGKAYAFRFKDWADYQLNNMQIGTGNGTQTVFQMVKIYTVTDMISSAVYSYSRPITKPVPNTLSGISVGGSIVSTSTYTLDYTTGLITFNTAPANNAAIVIPYCEFDVPARFDTDRLDVSQEYFETETWSDIPVVEIKFP